MQQAETPLQSQLKHQNDKNDDLIETPISDDTKQSLSDMKISPTALLSTA
jgi:hypothetical protein